MTLHRQDVNIRHAREADGPALERLAALDSKRAPGLPALIAEVDGEPVAALGLDDGGVVADPFAPTVDAVALLEMRAAQLGRPERRRRHLAPVPAVALAAAGEGPGRFGRFVL